MPIFKPVVKLNSVNIDVKNEKLTITDIFNIKYDVPKFERIIEFKATSVYLLQLEHATIL